MIRVVTPAATGLLPIAGVPGLPGLESVLPLGG